MNVKAHSGARPKASGEPLLGPLEVGRQCQFVERWVPFHDSNFHACSSDNSSFVGRRRAVPSPICRLELGKPKGLRGLHSDQSGSINRITDALADLRERVADRQYGRSAFEEFQAREEPVNDADRAEGARRVVNEDRIGRNGVEALSDGIGPLRSTDDQLSDVEAVEGQHGGLFLPRADDNMCKLHRGVTDQSFHGPAQYGFSAQQAKLFGNAATHAGPASGGNDESGGSHGGGV